MNLVLSTLILLAGLTQASGGVAGQVNHASLAIRPSATVGTSQPQSVATTVVTSGDSFLGEPLWPEQTQDNVLVVPTPDLPAESLADLTADLAVMCRIFDKAVGPSRTGVGVFGVGGYGTFRYSVGQQSAQALYLDGYGALFFIDVDYPLVPPPQLESSPAKPPEPTDSVWSQTIDEMSGRQESKTAPGRAAETYDPQKVENLKKTLIKTLAHAGNIRARRPQDFITLVAGPLDKSGVSYYGRSGRGTSRLAVRPGVKGPQASVSAPAALLVLRITKADVDAAAKGQLTSSQFAEKVQILWSQPSPSEPQARSAPGTVPSASQR